MCYNAKKKCIMCSEETDLELNLCAEGMRGNICVIMPMQVSDCKIECKFDIKFSKPRAGSRMYINVKPFIATTTTKYVCDNCQAHEPTAADEHENGLRTVVAALKTYPTMFDARQIHTMTSRPTKKDK
jgi:hypothetical protein